jgi:serine/threonine protein kinase
VTTRAVGRYELLREVGRGGMAIVHLARQRPLERFVALKELRTVGLSDAAAARRFLRESRLAGSLSHPNIVTVHDYFEWDGTAYIAMEYIARGSLRPWVGRLGSAEAVGVVVGVLAALGAAERERIVHRDLKPENIMVTAEGSVKIADFGIARALGNALPDDSATATGMTIGTPSYMAPEQARGETVDHRADLYALGAVIYRCLTGRVPFVARDTPALLYAVVHIMPVRPSAFGPISPQVEAFLQIALAKSREARFESGAELAMAFAAAEQGTLPDLLVRRARKLAQQLPWTEPDASTIKS